MRLWLLFLFFPQFVIMVWGDASERCTLVSHKFGTDQSPGPHRRPWIAHSVTVRFIRCDSCGPIKWRSLTSVLLVEFVRGTNGRLFHPILKQFLFTDSRVAWCFIIAEGQSWLSRGYRKIDFPGIVTAPQRKQPYVNEIMLRVSYKPGNIIATYTWIPSIFHAVMKLHLNETGAVCDSGFGE